MKIWGPNKNKESPKKNLGEPSLLSNSLVLKHTVFLRFLLLISQLISCLKKNMRQTICQHLS